MKKENRKQWRGEKEKHKDFHRETAIETVAVGCVKVMKLERKHSDTDWNFDIYSFFVLVIFKSNEWLNLR
jgi:hypothetical protein